MENLFARSTLRRGSAGGCNTLNKILIWVKYKEYNIIHCYHAKMIWHNCFRFSTSQAKNKVQVLHISAPHAAVRPLPDELRIYILLGYREARTCHHAAEGMQLGWAGSQAPPVIRVWYSAGFSTFSTFLSAFSAFSSFLRFRMVPTWGGFFKSNTSV